jgi:hypothetical protein
MDTQMDEHAMLLFEEEDLLKLKDKVLYYFGEVNDDKKIGLDVLALDQVLGDSWSC